MVDQAQTTDLYGFQVEEQGLLAEVTCDHDFDRVVIRRVFVGNHDRQRVEKWFEGQKESLLKYDREADPSFAAYGYSLVVRELLVESNYA